MNEITERIALCIERGKMNKTSPVPPDMKDQDGADELTRQALESGISPDEILKACNKGMHAVGEQFSLNKVFIPGLLLSAKAMGMVMDQLKPFFQSGNLKAKGTFVLGTVAGDLHDIGKNLVGMVVEGNGWKVIDLGVDVKAEKFLETIKENPGCSVGLSALLTTTMDNMAETVKQLKSESPDTKIIVGGAPLSETAAEEMGADGYAQDPQSAVSFLENL